VGRTAQSGVDVAVAASAHVVDGAGRSELDPRVARPVSLAAGSRIVIESFGSVTSSNDAPDPLERALTTVRDAESLGYASVRAESAAEWERIWRDHDIVIEGDPVDQTLLRFCTYHQRICTPAHADHLPIGARGLSCQAYQGAAFWDQEVYNLPAYLFTEPGLARSILEYRHRTLDGARRKAARLGYAGAYYAWISGITGDELCPDHFFVDVLTGRPIRNHFNVWQMHVAPDVVTSIERYVEVTGDRQFVVEHGAEIAFEVARFLHSFVRYDEWRGRYHCIRLLGPDEWHENVDDNAFTNHQVVAALRFAIDTHDWLRTQEPDRYAALAAQIELGVDEVDGWRRVHDRMHLPAPGDDDVIEQFAGFFDLEDTTPDVLRTRLLHPEEYWGWPNGVAVETQVAKQADVAMLLWLHADRFDDDVVRANYEYYEPRCSHNSSLSHAAFGMLAARLGDVERAHEHFRATASVDLLNTQHAVVGGTFIGGIHTAACGGTLQLAVAGFGGLACRQDALVIDPRLPPRWTSMTYPVNWRGQRLSVTISDEVTVTAHPDNDAPVDVVVDGARRSVAP
jgi:trehalose/maltose hydrolase-like predicted phosphorylase